MALEQLEPRVVLTVSLPPSISGSIVELDNNLEVADGSWDVTATDGYVQIFGNSKGRIDGTANNLNENLLLSAQSFITVTGAVGSSQPLRDLTLTSATKQPVVLQQSVTLSGDLRVTSAGTFTVGSNATIGRNLVIDSATTVLFSGNVFVAGDLTISAASSVTFAGTLTVGGRLTIGDVSGATRFAGDVSAATAVVTSTTNIQIQSGFAATAGDVTFTSNKINFSTAMISGSADGTLTVKPRDTARSIAIGSPPNVATGLAITDADLYAIQSGWKRLVLGDEMAGTGAVRVGSIGSQYGNSQILNTTTIVGGSIVVEQAVDASTLAEYLEFNARTGGVTVDAPINQTAEERNDWVRVTAAGTVAINKPIFAKQTVSLTTTVPGGTVVQAGGASGGSGLVVPRLAVVAEGTVTLADRDNAWDTAAVTTTNDGIVLREDSGYAIGEITTTDSTRATVAAATVTGIAAGSGTVRLVTNGGTVTQTKAVTATELGLEGTGGAWALSLATNDIDRLAANTGSVTLVDGDDVTIGSVLAVAPQQALSGIHTTGLVSVTGATSVSVKNAIDSGTTVDLKGTTKTLVVEATVDAGGVVTLEAGTVLTLAATGDVSSDVTSGTAVTLRGTGGITTAADVTTLGGDVLFEDAVTLTGDIVLKTVSGGSTGVVRFKSTVDGTTSGTESLTVTGNLETLASVGVTTALESVSVSGTSALAGGTTVRTVGSQTYTGKATSGGAVTVRAGAGSVVSFLGEVSLVGLVTTGEAYDVSLTGTPVTITDAVTFRNTGAVTLGDGSGDVLTFNGGLTSTAASVTNVAGTIATSDDQVTLGKTFLAGSTTVTTGTGNATFSGTVDGGQSLAVNSGGTTTFGGSVGGTTALVSLSTNAGGTTAINGGSVKTTGSDGQVYGDAVTLGANTVLDAAAGAIRFAGTLDGGYRLDANTTGTTTFDGAVGSKSALTHVETNAGGTTAINGGSIRTSSADSQIFNDAVLLGANTVLDAAAGAIRFAASV